MSLILLSSSPHLVELVYGLVGRVVAEGAGVSLYELLGVPDVVVVGAGVVGVVVVAHALVVGAVGVGRPVLVCVAGLVDEGAYGGPGVVEGVAVGVDLDGPGGGVGGAS